jgi:hypothetical protein
MKLCEVWIEQCEAARQIEAEFGTLNALEYLIGEKIIVFDGCLIHGDGSFCQNPWLSPRPRP